MIFELPDFTNQLNDCKQDVLSRILPIYKYVAMCVWHQNCSIISKLYKQR